MRKNGKSILNMTEFKNISLIEHCLYKTMLVAIIILVKYVRVLIFPQQRNNYVLIGEIQ